MQNINKSGFSSIIQVTIISALSIISLLLIFGYVKDLSANLDEQLSPVVDCISMQSKITDACVNEEGKLEVSLNAGLDEKISSLDMNIDGQLFSCDNSCQSCTTIEKEGRNTIYLSPTNANPNNLVASINGCTPQQLEIKRCYIRVF